MCLPGFIQPQSEPEQLTRKYRQKRKRASSDSSIIEARHSHRKRTKAAKRAHSSDEAESAGPAVARSRSSQSSQRSSSIARQAPRKSYDKRARHKTKADRYEIKSKKPRKEREPREEERSRPTRRKSHRSGDGRRTTGLVQSFQLKNGPKNSRLTVSRCMLLVLGDAPDICGVSAEARSYCWIVQARSHFSAGYRTRRRSYVHRGPK